jgi:cystathionine beta-lyase family protein involved in aluminum resistance
MHLRALFAALLGAVAVTCAADSPTYSIDAHIIAAGSSTQATSSCFHMDAVIAEPVAGFSAGGDFTLNAGYFAVAPPTSDDIFFDGFEDCTP